VSLARTADIAALRESPHEVLLSTIQRLRCAVDRPS
jgi:hypothetical protein